MTGAYTFDSAAVHARLGLLADLAAVRRGMMLLPEGGGDTQQRLQLAGEASRLLRALRETAPATPADQQLDSAGTDRPALLAELRRAMDALAAADDPVVRLDLLAEVARLRKALGDGAGASAEPEPADDPDAFVEAPGGGLDFGEITAEMAQAAGRQPGRIRLQVGNASWGMMHIEQRHGAEIRGAGFAGVADFVADVARHIDQVWKPATTRQLVALHADAKNRVLFVELQPGRDDAGDFYSVKTAFPARPGYTKKAGWKLLWEARAQASGDSGNRPPFADPLQ